jgi:hypothetical protein
MQKFRADLCERQPESVEPAGFLTGPWLRVKSYGSAQLRLPSPGLPGFFGRCSIEGARRWFDSNFEAESNAQGANFRVKTGRF